MANIIQALILPEKFPPPAPLLDLQLLLLVAPCNEEFEAAYSTKLQPFNKIQAQVFRALCLSGDRGFIRVPAGSGKAMRAEFAPSYPLLSISQFLGPFYFSLNAQAVSS